MCNYKFRLIFMSEEIVLAADLGGTNLRMAAIDRRGKILYRTRRETPRGEAADEIVRAIVESANECRKNCAGYRVEAISAAVPATVSVGEGAIVTAPNLPALNNFKMAAALENKLGVKAFLENDANAAAIGENWLGASKAYKNSIYITLGTGVGGGIIVDGKILRGVGGGTAGEIGHLCVEAFGAPCGCGSVGCLEQYSSASAIVRLAEELKAQHPESALKNKIQLSALEVFQAGTDGDELALEVFRQMGFYLGVAVTSLTNVLSPEIIVIGGGASAGWELFAPRMQETVCRRAYGGTVVRAQIVRGELGDDAGISGAARFAFDSSA